MVATIEGSCSLILGVSIAAHKTRGATQVVIDVSADTSTGYSMPFHPVARRF
jgi:hypothetical protein